MRDAILLALSLGWVSPCWTQDSTVQGTLSVLHQSATEADSSDAVVWLTPIHSTRPVSSGPPAHLAQKNKKFIPHIIVTAGTEIEFPNQDLFFHNVFSIHQGKTFDLGLYESGAARKVRFTQPGISYIFCNIHPEMSAVVVVLNTRYFGLSDPQGNVQISHVPPGHYKLNVWYELDSEPEFASLAQEIEINPGENHLPKLTLHSSDTPKPDTNKLGEPY